MDVKGRRGNLPIGIDIEHFPLVAVYVADDELHGFLFGSLERIGGTPCILWGLGAIRKGRNARTTLVVMGTGLAVMFLGLSTLAARSSAGGCTSSQS